MPQLLSLRSRTREPQLLSPRATTTEARAPRDCAPQQREATAMRSPRTAMKSRPHLLQLEKAHVQKRRPKPAKKKQTKKLYPCQLYLNKVGKKKKPLPKKKEDTGKKIFTIYQ